MLSSIDVGQVGPRKEAYFGSFVSITLTDIVPNKSQPLSVTGAAEPGVHAMCISQR